jgi:hypothetical protein
MYIKCIYHSAYQRSLSRKLLPTARARAIEVIQLLVVATCILNYGKDFVYDLTALITTEDSEVRHPSLQCM